MRDRLTLHNNFLDDRSVSTKLYFSILFPGYTVCHTNKVSNNDPYNCIIAPVMPELADYFIILYGFALK